MLGRLGARPVVEAALGKASRGTQKQSEAIAGNKRHPEAIGNNRKHSKAVGSHPKHSEASGSLLTSRRGIARRSRASRGEPRWSDGRRRRRCVGGRSARRRERAHSTRATRPSSWGGGTASTARSATCRTWMEGRGRRCKAHGMLVESRGRPRKAVEGRGKPWKAVESRGVFEAPRVDTAGGRARPLPPLPTGAVGFAQRRSCARSARAQREIGEMGKLTMAAWASRYAAGRAPLLHQGSIKGHQGSVNQGSSSAHSF